MNKPIDIEELRHRLHQLPTITAYQCETLRQALAIIDELEHAHETVSRLRDEYRKKLITYRFGGFICCDGCGEEWRRDNTEKHSEGCLAKI